MKAIALLLLLAACAPLPTKPIERQVETVTVEKPVPVPCIAAADIPPKTPTVMDPKADAARKAAAAYVDMHNLVQENDTLRALLVQCSQQGN